MPSFANPFYGNLPPGKMSLNELVRAIRLDIAGELEAISIYQAHADATDNPLAKSVLLDIANEERVHVGELTQVMRMLLDDETAFLEEGAEEVLAAVAELGISSGTGAGEVATVGSLKE